jgi:hypothetical protein
LLAGESAARSNLDAFLFQFEKAGAGHGVLLRQRLGDRGEIDT